MIYIANNLLLRGGIIFLSFRLVGFLQSITAKKPSVVGFSRPEEETRPDVGHRKKYSGRRQLSACVVALSWEKREENRQM